MYNLFKYIGIRHLKLKPGRALLTILGVALGIALYVAIAIINQSTKNTFRESIESIAGKAKLSVSAGPAGFDESKIEIIKHTPGVKFGVPMIEARAFFEGARESTDGLYVLGVDLLQEQSVRSYQATDQKIIDDPLVFLNQPDSIILTTRVAQARGLKIDSKVRLTTANGVKTFTVRGLLEPEGAARAYGGALAIMDIDGARMMFGKENKVDRVDIVPEANVPLAIVRKNLEAALGSGYFIETPDAQSEQSESMIRSYQVVLTFFSTLALLVGLFLVMNSISVSVAERRKEIGTLRALGATRASMVLLFVTEVIGIGLTGSILGCVLGKLLAHRIVKEVVASMSAQFQTHLEVTKLDFTPHQIIFSILLGTFASVIAALLPALKAAQVHPLESMKRHTENLSSKEESNANGSIWLGLGLLVWMSGSMYFGWMKIWIGIDLLTKIASVMGSALFGPFLVFLLIRFFRRLNSKNPSIVLKLAQENLLRSRKRTSSNVMALMVGLFLVMLIATVRVSFHDTIMSWLDRIFVADIMVASSGRMITADVQPMREEIEKEVLAVPGIRPVGANRGTASLIARIQYQNRSLIVKALDHYADWYQFKNLDIQGGDRFAIATELYASTDPLLLATPTFLKKQNKKVGDAIDLDTPKGRVSFKVIGTITDFASPEGVLYLNRATYKKYWNDSLVTAFVFSLLPGYSLEPVRAEIDRRIGKKWNVVTFSNREFKQQMQEAIDRSFAYTRAIELIALLVGMMGLLNTLLISVMERTREIGTLRAIGTTRSQISRIILLEAALQGIFGALVAVLLGAYVGKMFVEYGLSTTLGWRVDFYFPTASIFFTLITGVGVAMIAGFFPARRAARLNITEALEYE